MMRGTEDSGPSTKRSREQSRARQLSGDTRTIWHTRCQTGPGRTSATAIGPGKQARLWNGRSLQDIPAMDNAMDMSESGEVLGQWLVEGVERMVTWTTSGGTREVAERTSDIVIPVGINSWGDVLANVNDSAVRIWTWAPERWQ